MSNKPQYAVCVSQQNDESRTVFEIGTNGIFLAGGKYYAVVEVRIQGARGAV